MNRSSIATSLPEFIQRIAEIESAWTTKRDGAPGLWFRGSGKSTWALIPKLYRTNKSINLVLGIEDEIREEFIRRAPALTAFHPANEWEWYFLMQHYGAPTRLLDWTESPLTALYFAVKDNEGLQDAAVWVLDPWWLNDKVVGKGLGVLPPGSPGLAKSDIKRYRAWLPARFEAKGKLKTPSPVAIFPTQFDRRIAAQRSCFTIHGRRPKTLDQLFPRDSDKIAKIIIPSYVISEMRDELIDYCTDEATIFPDLEGLGKAVSRNWLSNDERAHPHEALLTRLRPSKIHKGGVGVFAITPIKKGTKLFAFDSDEIAWIDAKRLPRGKEARNFYRDFAIQKRGESGKIERYGCPRHFNCLTMSWYLNDPPKGEKPNVRCDQSYEFWTLRAIKEGEELLVDSGTYSDHPAFPTGRRPNARRVTK